MENKRKDSLSINLVQIGVWILILLIPGGINYMISGGTELSGNMMKALSVLMIGPLFLYILNYTALVPRFLFSEDRKKRKWFYLANIIIILVLNFSKFFPGKIPSETRELIPFGDNEIAGMYATIIILSVIFQSIFILLAVGVRYIMRSHRQKIALQEAKRQNAEAELSWLKNQLNPHFLFNTLNNISSLTQIDPDRAQESIGQLSSLLRYALYESNAPTVPLDGEISFMEDYIDLMSLRCNELTTVKKNFVHPKGSVQIAPLLFISLIENAFKHGVNSRHISHVDIKMYPDGEDLVFRCSNSFFEKTGSDEIGSGIGLENMKRRLELIYPGAYKYTAGREGEEYSAVVILKGILSKKADGSSQIPQQQQ